MFSSEMRDSLLSYCTLRILICTLKDVCVEEGQEVSE